MSRLTRGDWAAYALLRNYCDRQTAEQYRHLLNARNAKRGIHIPADREPRWLFVHEYGVDGYIVKTFLEGPQSDDDINDFIEANWIHPPCSAYDCTGCRFTCCMDAFRVPHGVWIYHYVSVDC